MRFMGQDLYNDPMADELEMKEKFIFQIEYWGMKIYLFNMICTENLKSCLKH